LTEALGELNRAYYDYFLATEALATGRGDGLGYYRWALTAAVRYENAVSRFRRLAAISRAAVALAG